MVNLELRVDEAALAADAADAAHEDATVLQMSYFEMPVRLLVNGVELFGSEPPLPLLDVAVVGLRAVRRAAAEGSAAYGIPNVGATLSLRRAGTLLEMTTTPKGTQASAPATEAVEAWEAFARRVRALLHERVPGLQEHPVWGPWLASGELPAPFG